MATIKYNQKKSTLTEIMFVNTKAAYKIAEECAARKRAAKERAERSCGEFTVETKSCDSDTTVSVRSESTWLSDRNEKNKSEAMTMIEDTIKTQEVRKQAVVEMIEHNMEIGSARLDSVNERGTHWKSSLLVFSMLSSLTVR
jgi:hypothetical protein